MLRQIEALGGVYRYPGCFIAFYRAICLPFWSIGCLKHWAESMEKEIVSEATDCDSRLDRLFSRHFVTEVSGRLCEGVNR